MINEAFNNDHNNLSRSSWTILGSTKSHPWEAILSETWQTKLFPPTLTDSHYGTTCACYWWCTYWRYSTSLLSTLIKMICQHIFNSSTIFEGHFGSRLMTLTKMIITIYCTAVVDLTKSNLWEALIIDGVRNGEIHSPCVMSHYVRVCCKMDVEIAE